MKAKVKDVATLAVLVLAGLAAVVGSTGCDEMWVDGIGYVNPWYTSAYYGVPAATYYDPTAEIQSAAEYRGAVMQEVADNFDGFIME